MYPYSKLRSIWDVVMIIFVIYNVMVLPMAIGLELDKATWRIYLDYFIDLFFACDIVLNFFTGFVDSNNKLIMN